MRALIAGGLVIDATLRGPLREGAVLVEDGRIVAVGKAEDFSTMPSGTRVIDAAGCTVMPGLVDAHVHVLNHPRRGGLNEGEAALWASNYLRSALQGGVTTLRDLGALHEAIFSLKTGVERGWFVGPRMLVAGPAICMTGGHGHAVFSQEADGPDEARRLARRSLKAGADLVKVMATGGAATLNESPTATQLTVAEMTAAVEEAHSAGKPAAAHATSTRGIKNSLLAGVDSVEHGCYLDDETVEMMLQQDVVLTPTLSAYRRLVEAGPLNLAADHMVRRAAALVDAHMSSFQLALRAGVKVILGTDCGSAFHPLGDVALELELWVQAGMEPLEAIRAATITTAIACRIGQETGSLESGKRADLLVVEGDVLADIRALNRVKLVMRDGSTVYDRSVDSSVGLPEGQVLGPRPRPLIR